MGNFMAMSDGYLIKYFLSDSEFASMLSKQKGKIAEVDKFKTSCSKLRFILFISSKWLVVLIIILIDSINVSL